jgi:hypothetical protein
MKRKYTKHKVDRKPHRCPGKARSNTKRIFAELRGE